MKFLKASILLLFISLLFSCSFFNTGFVINNTSSNSSIYTVNISPTSSDYWGDDLLGNSFLSAGESQTFFQFPDSYDIRLEDISFYYFFYDIPLTMGETITINYDGDTVTMPTNIQASRNTVVSKTVSNTPTLK